MVTKQMVQGTWNEVVGRLRAKWGQLNQNDLEQFKGNTEAPAGYIQRHTGEARETVMRFLDDLLADGSDKASHAADTVRDYASRAASTARHSSMRPHRKCCAIAMPTPSISFKIGRQFRLARHLPRQRSSGSALRCLCVRGETRMNCVRQKEGRFRFFCVVGQGLFCHCQKRSTCHACPEDARRLVRPRA